MITLTNDKFTPIGTNELSITYTKNGKRTQQGNDPPYTVNGKLQKSLITTN